MKRCRALAADRKAKREEKRKTLPWAEPPEEILHGPWTKGRVLTHGTFKGYLVVKRPAKTRRKLLRGKLDDLWAFFIKLRDRIQFGRCRICNVRPIEVAYHIIPRGDDATRWDEENGCGACHQCNRGEQMNRSRYRAKHVTIFGSQLVEKLEAKARVRAGFTLTDLENMVASFTAKIAALTALTRK